MTKQQINPPFDGSAPCPACASGPRGIAAYAYNLLNRWREDEALHESKFWSKLHDLRRSATGEPGYQDPRERGTPIKALIESEANADADVKAHLEAIDHLVRFFADAITYDPKVDATTLAPSIKPFVDRLRVTERPFNALTEAHFDDKRHYSGEENILRAQRGYAAGRGGREGEYNFTVDVLTDTRGSGGDLVHKPCGTHLVLHAHFRERIARDRAWYGKVWCEVCGINAPWAQFECRLPA